MRECPDDSLFEGNPTNLLPCDSKVEQLIYTVSTPLHMHTSIIISIVKIEVHYDCFILIVFVDI
jgi:transposase